MVKNFILRDIALKYGFVLGLILSAIFLLGAITGAEDQLWIVVLRNGLIFAAIFLGHRLFKEKHEGFMSFAEGTKLGSYLVAVSSVIPAFVAFVYTRFINASFLIEMREKTRFEYEKTDLPEEELEQSMAIMEYILSPEGLFISGIFGGIMIGIIYSIIVTLFTRNESLSS